MSSLKVSVITVVYNGEKTIADTLKSVQRQNYPNIEHIVIDGASTDQTMPIINSCKQRVSVLVSEPDNGIYDAMNKGLALATGDIIGFLNADDFYANDSVVSTIVEYFANDDFLHGTYADLVYVDPEKVERIIRYWRSGEFIHGSFAHAWVPAHPTFYVRRSVYEKHGYFDLDYKIAADQEIMMRLLELHGIKVKYIPEILVKMRMGGATNASFTNIITQNKEILRAAKKNGLHFSKTTFILAKLYSRLPQFFSRPIENDYH